MGNEPTSCCGDGGASGGCGCGPSTGPRNWLKTLLFAAVLLAALIVGVYSLWSQPSKPAPTRGQAVTQAATDPAAQDRKAADCSKKCDSTSKSACCD